MRKSGKSNYTDLIVENADSWEMFLNSGRIQDYKNQLRQASAPRKPPSMTYVSIKNVTPEDLTKHALEK